MLPLSDWLILFRANQNYYLFVSDLAIILLLRILFSSCTLIVVFVALTWPNAPLTVKILKFSPFGG